MDLQQIDFQKAHGRYRAQRENLSAGLKWSELGKQTSWVRRTQSQDYEYQLACWNKKQSTFDRHGTLGFCWLRMNIERNFNWSFDSWYPPSWNLPDMSQVCLQRNHETNENLRRTKDLIKIYNWANPTSRFPSPPSFLPLIWLGLGFSHVCGSLEMDLWQIYTKQRLMK